MQIDSGELLKQANEIVIEEWKKDWSSPPKKVVIPAALYREMQQRYIARQNLLEYVHENSRNNVELVSA